MSLGMVVVPLPLRGGSDGDATHRPTREGFKQVSQANYLEKLGTLWMKARGDYQPGITYRLQQLPAGYAVYGRAREKDPKHVDVYLYGHPTHKPFDSPNRFFPHFKHLMDNHGSSIGCPCTVCNAQGGIIPPMGVKRARGFSNTDLAQTTRPKAPASVSQPTAHKAMGRGRPKKLAPGLDTSRADEEGTPDVVRNLIDKLKRVGTLDQEISEPMSIDWRAEQECLPRMKEELAKGRQYLPRVGEIVLFIRNMPADVSLARERKTGNVKLCKDNKFIGDPEWEAGVVGQTPTEERDIEDLVIESDELNVSLSGVRVEPIPHPNSRDKSLSKRYTYVPLHQTRPFIFWKEFLGHIDEDDWHPTIQNALAAMATFSLVNKYRFRGKWPEAWIFCHGIYVGPELLAVGDTIRIIPAPNLDIPSPHPDVLVIESIRLRFTNLDRASGNDNDEGHPHNTSAHILGKGYTVEQARSSKEWLSFDDTRTRPMEGYPELHPLQPPEKTMVVPLGRVIGRLYEAEAMTLWLLSSFSGEDGNSDISANDLDHGVQGIRDAREFAREEDERIDPVLGPSWFWGNDRAEALDLHTVNGLEVSRHDEMRNPKELRKTVRILQETEQLARHEQKAAQRGLRRFMAPAQLGADPQSAFNEDERSSEPVEQDFDFQQYSFMDGSTTGRLDNAPSGSGMGSGTTTATTTTRQSSASTSGAELMTHNNIGTASNRPRSAMASAVVINRKVDLSIRSPKASSIGATGAGLKREFNKAIETPRQSGLASLGSSFRSTKPSSAGAASGAGLKREFDDAIDTPRQSGLAALGSTVKSTINSIMKPAQPNTPSGLVIGSKRKADAIESPKQSNMIASASGFKKADRVVIHSPKHRSTPIPKPNFQSTMNDLMKSTRQGSSSSGPGPSRWQSTGQGNSSSGPGLPNWNVENFIMLSSESDKDEEDQVVETVE